MDVWKNYLTVVFYFISYIMIVSNCRAAILVMKWKAFEYFWGGQKEEKK